MKFSTYLETLEVSSYAILIHNTKANFVKNIISGEKTIETRGVKLPNHFVNKPVELVTYINKKRYSIGKITFSGMEVYPFNDIGLEKWERDRNKHMVPVDSAYNLKHIIEKTKNIKNRARFGWVIKNVEKYDSPIPYNETFGRDGLVK